MRVSFYGVRGSTPCSCPDLARYGGNTSCVAVEAPGEHPIVLDLGTGARFFGQVRPGHETYEGTVLLSHLHWDHVQGLPFFGPALARGASIDIYVPEQVGQTGAEAFNGFFRPPYFPITVDQMPATISVHDCPEGIMHVGGIEVLSRLIPHVGPTLGYRLTWQGRSVAYLPDHQQPVDDRHVFAEAALALCADADLVIHDAQFTREDFVSKAHWGHCTVDYAVELAIRSKARRLALFHHDPSRTDDAIDELERCAMQVGERFGLQVFAASEGMSIEL